MLQTTNKWGGVWLSHQYACAINQKCLADLMGHTTIRTTGRYVHADEKYLQGAIQNMENHISQVMPTEIEASSRDQKCPVKCPVGSNTGCSASIEIPCITTIRKELQMVGDRGLEPPTPTMSR